MIFAHFLQAHTFQLHFKQCASLPVTRGNPHCVLVDGIVYTGGGHTERKQDMSLVFKYDFEKDQWATLPPCPSELFGLGHLSGKLIAAGGILWGRVTGNVYSFHTDSHSWKEIPAMPTPRFRPTVVSHRLAIAVCGGIEKTNVVSDKVEVLRDGSSQWYTVGPLPMAGCLMKPAIVGDTCYLMGGYSTWHPSIPTNNVMHSPVASLFTPSSRSSNASVWRLLPRNMPYNRSVAASLGGLLLAIGGWDETATNAVFAYSPAAPSWVQVGNLPSSHRAGGAVTLPGGEVMVVGGIDDRQESISTVLLLSLQF